MGRPREHDDETREALRAAAERLFDRSGAAAVSVRAVADEVGTTTRAVYSLFGSQEGLLVDALAERAYEILTRGVDEQPETDDPAQDLVEMSVDVFRRFVLEHPALYRITFQRVVPSFQPGPEVLRVREHALSRLTAKVQRLGNAGVLHGRSVEEATMAYQAMCEGLANFELRGAIMRMFPADHEEEAWRTAVSTLVGGLTRPEGASPPARRARR